jgi:hypothetical protein
MKEGKQQELEEYVLKLEADCTNKEEAASLAEKQVCCQTSPVTLYFNCIDELPTDIL